MEEHEQEERELVGAMERSLAAAIGASASLLEAYFRRRARQAGRTPAEKSSDERSADEHQEVDREVRKELALYRDDGEMWRSADYEVINDQILREQGIDPRRIGEPTADKEWVTRATGAEVLDVYAAADKWAGRSETAEAVRANIAEQLQEYGIDLNELLSAPPEAGAEMIETARAAHWAQRGHDPTGTPAERTAADRDGRQVQQLLGQAGAADRDADRSAAQARDLGARGDHLAAQHRASTIVVDGTVVDTTASRSTQAADARGHTGAGKAAAMAARDHPTHPRQAAATPASKSAKAAPSRTAPARERGHGR
ncbi:hypothetical protein DFR67_12626 [Williamsia limnetica]|uniref:Uncharacterized protein n=1 Tax=Williamsia limnetica TaxID=882452 RepID=A0A318RG01_WILLI|nr:hypothetical protein [Williamsia limnetica]PYE12018.1 hypothetical protein DFR67_12626 [Williamsia limnetica]